MAIPSSLRPITPIDTGKSPTNGRSKSRTKVASGKKREPSHQLRPKINPQRASYHTKSPPSTITSSSYSNIRYVKLNYSIQEIQKNFINLLATSNCCENFSSSAMPSLTQSMPGSLPMINEYDDYALHVPSSTVSKPPSHSTAPPRTVSPAPPRNVSPAFPKMVSPAVSEKPPVKISTLDNEVGILSDSSSSSSSDSSDSDSEPETKPQPTKVNGNFFLLFHSY